MWFCRGVLFADIWVMITGKNIYKRYDTVEVLKGVDLEIKKGELVAIVGPSGSGKSTLLHILSTLDRPDEGQVEINGIPIILQPKVALEPAIWWKRVINRSLDVIFLGLISYGIAKIFAPQFLVYYEEKMPSLIFGNYPLEFYLYNLLLVISYYLFFEALTGRTIAKFITNTKVVIADEGTKPKFINCLIRIISRFIPFEFLSFFSKRPVGWHDSLGGTKVIDNKGQFIKKVEGRMSRNQLSHLRNSSMGFVFQFHHLLPEFTALENVCIPGWLAGRKKAEVKTEAERLLTMLGLSQRMENKPNQLSGGEQQRVAVARALINKPDIIFADEPTGNLDSANAKELHQLFFDLRNKFDQTFLIVTHNEELAQLSDRLLHMKDGKIV